MRTLKTICLLSVLLIAFALPSQAQRVGSGLGLGFHLGEPTGLSIKYYGGRAGGFAAADMLLAWETSGSDRLFFGLHGLFERPMATVPLRFFYGPGLFVQTWERRDDDDEVGLGLSGNFGFSYFIERFDLFAQITPRLAFIPDTDLEIGGGFGARFYF